MSHHRRNFLKSGALGLTAAALSGSVFAQKTQQHTAHKAFSGKVVAITGGTSGIGAAAAGLFAAQGAKVVFCGRREALGKQVAADIRETGGDARYIKADVTKPEQVQFFVEQIMQTHGRLNVAFNNAGEVLFKPLHEFSLEEWEWLHNTNLRGVFLAMKHQIPAILASGGGNIIITSSQHAFSTRPGGAAYASSKRALEGLAQSAAMDYGQQGLRVCVLAPGITDTPMFRRATGQNAEAVAKANNLVRGLKRIASAQEVAQAALWLASDQAAYITGTTVQVDGGLLSGFS